MCGITGFVDYRKKTSVSTLREMTDAMHHRGPDDAGYEVYENPFSLVGFGQRRLSILDLSPLGHQPMHHENYIVNFNGEIYNFKEIRAELETKGFTFKSWSDTEVILKGYECWGIDVVNRFIGMFAIALWDRAERVLWLARDRIGKGPWHNAKGALIEPFTCGYYAVLRADARPRPGPVLPPSSPARAP